MAVFLFGAGGVSGALPSGYKLLKYIQSSGTQFIDTGFKPNQDTRVVMDVQLVTTTAQVLFSARTSANSKVTELIWHDGDGCYRFYYNDGYTNFSGAALVPTDRRTVEVDKNVATVAGQSVSRTYAAYACETNMVLLARSTLGTISAYASAMLYSCKIYDNGVLVRDFVPCQNDSGVIGLWDKVDGKFYKNAGTGAFLGG